MALRPSARDTAKLALIAAIAGITAAGVKGRLTRYEISEASMEPALKAGDYLLTAVAGSIERGDIVIYPDPARSGLDLVKRVVGLPQETVAIAGGQVAINGAVLAEPWADGPTWPDGQWTNPPGTIFTIGDNRQLSAGDSRQTGPVSAARIHKAIFRYWPPTAVGRI